MSESKTRVLVLGKTGMLGQMVRRVLKADKRLYVCGTQMEDRKKPFYFNVLEGQDGLRSLLGRGAFDYCINCIGITAAKIRADDPDSIERARLINAAFPWQLARQADAAGCRVIHMSTDGVFSGSRPWYDERSRPDCRDIYGISKRDGEANGQRFLVIRCSIVGPSPYEGGGLWEWVAGLAGGSTVNGFTNHYWNGVTTLQFAQLCHAIIASGRFESIRKQSGLYHFSPNKAVTKYALLVVLKKALKKGITLTKAVQGRNAVRRILRTRFTALKELVPHGLTMEQAINRLTIYERKHHG